MFQVRKVSKLTEITKALSQYTDLKEYIRENGEGKSGSETHDTIKQVEGFYTKCTVRIQRIIRYRFFEHKTWNEAAEILKAKSGESLRKEFTRYINKNDI